MSELAIDIEMLLESGTSPDDIADSLGIPLKWVLAVRDAMYAPMGDEGSFASNNPGTDRVW
jgi:hypothetical protein